MSHKVGGTIKRESASELIAPSHHQSKARIQALLMECLCLAWGLT